VVMGSGCEGEGILREGGGGGGGEQMGDSEGKECSHEERQREGK
jgi:hypothetical protein